MKNILWVVVNKTIDKFIFFVVYHLIFFSETVDVLTWQAQCP